jgi:glutathione S-transferase
MLTFYYAPRTCALATHIALEEAGANYKAVRVDFSKGEQRSPEYLRLNPKGRVPLLVTGKGALTENPALLLYIAQTHPQVNLAPLGDAFAMAKLNAFLSYLCSTVHPFHAHKLRGARWTDDPAAQESMKAKVPQNMGDAFTLIETEYFAGPWTMGEAYSVADAYLFTIANWLEGDGVDPRRFPKVWDFMQRMAERPAVLRTLAQEA